MSHMSLTRIHVILPYLFIEEVSKLYNIYVVIPKLWIRNWIELMKRFNRLSFEGPYSEETH